MHLRYIYFTRDIMQNPVSTLGRIQNCFSQSRIMKLCQNVHTLIKVHILHRKKGSLIPNHSFASSMHCSCKAHIYIVPNYSHTKLNQIKLICTSCYKQYLDWQPVNHSNQAKTGYTIMKGKYNNEEKVCLPVHDNSR